LTGDELSAKYKRQLEDYFEQQQKGEQQAEIIKNVRLRLDLLCRETLPFVSPHYWSGVCVAGFGVGETVAFTFPDISKPQKPGFLPYLRAAWHLLGKKPGF